MKLSHRALGLLGTRSIPFKKKKKKKKRRRKKQPHDAESSLGSIPGHVAEDKSQLQKPVWQQKPQSGKKIEPSDSHLQTWPQGQYQGKPKTFLEKMRSRLSGGQFRMLNERLYTCSGEEAFNIFKDDPCAFQCYHAGYREQMFRWPRQPVDAIIDWLRARSASLVVADFGCGDGRLAKSVQNQVFSLDLVATDTSIIACNMAHTPLETASVDVAVFCLSLMGTDYPSFLVEAYRVLKSRGSLLIAEVRSRFDPATGGANPDAFIKALNALGFSLISQDYTNQYFVMFELLKQMKKLVNKDQCRWPKLKPCIYKRR